MDCKYCEHSFKTKSIMKHHQKTAKYCLEIQQKCGHKVKYIYKCDYCQKNLSQKIDLDRHYLSCGIRKETLIQNKFECQITDLKTQLTTLEFQLNEQRQRYEKQIKELQDKLENVAIKAVQRPTTSNKTQINNYIQNMKPVTEEHLINNVQHLTIEHIKKGPEGYAEYALEYPLKDRMLCSDYSRRKVKFKDKDGNIITDPEMTTLARKFFNSIKEKNKELICKSANELKEKLGDDNIMDTVVKLFDYKSDIEKGSDGEKTEFHHDFVKQVCSQTIKE